MALFLTEQDVFDLLTPSEAVSAVEQCLREAGAGETVNLPRRRLRLPNGMLHMMAAAQPSQGMFALKAYTAFGGKVRFRILLYDAKTGDILALIEGDRMGQLRTGAATAVATRYMAGPTLTHAGLFGAGFQAEGQLEALKAVFPLARVHVYARNEERLRVFCQRMQARLGLEAIPVRDPREAVRGIPVVITATTSKEPVFDGHWLEPGTHVNAVGANLLIKREIDGTVLRKSRSIVVDTKEQAALESGALLHAIEAGHLHWDRVHELGELVAGRYQARTSDQDITLFHSLGMALWDTAVAIVVYRNAQKQGRGTELPLR